MIDYDFIEIGTSDFDTLIEIADDKTVGLSIEPLKCYLDRLPNKQNVIKVCAAVSPYGSNENIDMHYIPPEIIEQNNHHQLLKGCNRIGEVHPHILNHPSIASDLNSLLITESVKQITVKELYSEYNIHRIKFLKIDTEGFDCHILQQWLLFLKDKDDSFYPNKIMFETNTLTDIEFVYQTIEDFMGIGYRLESFKYDNRSGNTELVYES